jgi:iron complex transport system ATP-binding protein
MVVVASVPIVSLRDVSLVLDGRRVLSHIDWQVMRGENWAVIGPNGAGKTCLLSIINGYRWPSKGTVSVLGRSFGSSDLRELRKEVGLVSSYLDWMIGKDQKVVDLVLSGMFGSVRMWREVRRADVEQAMSALRAVGCFAHRDKAVSELSQGERQKVAIARALMAEPRLLVLDEPCEGLDLASRESLMEGLVSLLSRRRGHSLIEVTHRTEDIPTGFTHALLLRAGKVVASGRIEKTLTSSNLTRCLGTSVELKRWRGRYYMLATGGDGQEEERKKEEEGGQGARRRRRRGQDALRDLTD